MNKENYFYYYRGNKVALVDYAQYRMRRGDPEKETAGHLIDYDYLMAEGNERLRETIKKIENMPIGANIEPYENHEKAEIRTSDLVICPLHEYVEAEKLEEIIDNEERLYPWYRYKGQDVVIINRAGYACYCRSFPFADVALEYASDTAIVPLKAARLARVDWYTDMDRGILDNRMRSIRSLENEALDIHIDLSNRKPGMIKTRDTLLRHNGKEIELFSVSHRRRKIRREEQSWEHWGSNPRWKEAYTDEYFDLA